MARIILFTLIAVLVCNSDAFQPEKRRYLDCHRLQLHRLPKMTPIENLLLAGGRIISHRRRLMPTALGAVMKFRNFEEMLATFHDKPVLVSFQAKWCGPCKLMKKELKAVHEAMGDDVQLFSVDTEKWPSLGARYEVHGLPTVVIFYKGEILHRVEGIETADELVQRVKTLL